MSPQFPNANPEGTGIGSTVPAALPAPESAPAPPADNEHVAPGAEPFPGTPVEEAPPAQTVPAPIIDGLSEQIAKDVGLNVSELRAAVTAASQAASEGKVAISSTEDCILHLLNVVCSLPIHYIADHVGTIEEVRAYLVAHRPA